MSLTNGHIYSWWWIRKRQNFTKTKEIIISVNKEIVRQIMDINSYDELNQKTKDFLSELCIDRYFCVFKRNIEVLQDKEC